MATPATLVQAINASIPAQGKKVIRVNTFSPDGSPLDVHTGYTLQASLIPNQNANKDAATADISAQLTPTWDATGFDLLVNCAGVSNLSPTLGASISLFISNDAFTTQSVAAVMNTAINNFNGAL
jgi:hypothetical protein